MQKLKCTLLFIALFYQISNACTGFGIIVNSGIIIGRNRDYYYDPQIFKLVYPNGQFDNWYDNNYGHKNKFYALISKDNISMGVNQNGLSIIEEDAPRPVVSRESRKFHQPINGTAEGMIKYGILQNFNTIDEIIPFINDIFSIAEPDFYQIADSKKLLTVEVAYASKDNDKLRKYTYKIYTKQNDYFAHTNSYLNSQYSNLNNYRSDKDFSSGSMNRLQRITELISSTNDKSFDNSILWLKDMKSNVSSSKDANWCRNTSLFRTNLQNYKFVNLKDSNDNIYGTVSSMVIKNTGNPSTSQFYLLMLYSIVNDSNNQQLIKYKELNTTLANLFNETSPLMFSGRELIRNAPVNKLCK